MAITSEDKPMFLKVLPLFYPNEVPPWRKEIKQDPLYGAAQYASDVRVSYANWFEYTSEQESPILKIVVWTDEKSLIQTVELQGGKESSFVLITVSTKPDAPTGWTTRRVFDPKMGVLHLCFRLRDKTRLHPCAMYAESSSLYLWEQWMSFWMSPFF